MSTTEKSLIQIAKKLEKMINTFTYKVFNKDGKHRKIFVEIRDCNYKYCHYYEPIESYIYKNRIIIRSDYLDYILNNYKNNPELIKELMEKIFYNYINVFLYRELKEKNSEKYEELKRLSLRETVYGGILVLMENLYKTIISELDINPNKNIEEILEEVNNYVIEKFKDKKYLKNLEEKLRKKAKEEILVELDEILKKYSKCVNISYEDPEILYLSSEVGWHVYNKFPALIFQTNPGILKILKDLSSTPLQRILLFLKDSENVLMDNYKEIIFREYKNLGEKELIMNLLECVENKLNNYFKYIREEGINI